MAFRKLSEVNEERFGNLFILRNDGDYADVVFMYRNMDDVLTADTHYIKSADYTGYVHCNGRGCPACQKGIRVQPKLFIPLFNMTSGRPEFWDRTRRFENQLMQDVFSKYPNPSEFVFRIQRHGESGSIDTTYSIIAVGRNNVKPYDVICTENHISYPEYYDVICKEMSQAEMSSAINGGATSASANYSSMPEYRAVPRVASAPISAPPIVTPPQIVENMPPFDTETKKADSDDDYEIDDTPVDF